MKRVYLRIISFSDSQECFDRIKTAFSYVLENSTARNIDFCSFDSYWKIDGYGETNISFNIDNMQEISSIKKELSNYWKDEVTDSRWANIFCPDIHFIWCMVSEETFYSN